MAHEKIPKNDGWRDVAYELGSDPEDSARISKILNEACHVFHHHASGSVRAPDHPDHPDRSIVITEIGR